VRVTNLLNQWWGTLNMRGDSRFAEIMLPTSFDSGEIGFDMNAR